MRETVTALRGLDGAALRTPVVMAVRGPKARELAAGLADTVAFALMPGDDRAEITRVVRDFRALATRDIELPQHPAAIRPAAADSSTGTGTLGNLTHCDRGKRPGGTASASPVGVWAVASCGGRAAPGREARPVGFHR